MATLYILTGPPGVGKSTISKRLSESLSKAVLIEGDDIYNQVISPHISPWKEGNHLELFWRISLLTIQEYLKEDYNVVFNYIIDPEDLETIQNKINHSIKFVVLMVQEDEIIRRDQERDINCQMGERCLKLLKQFQNYQYLKDYKLYTDSLSIDECVKMIKEDDKYMIGD